MFSFITSARLSIFTRQLKESAHDLLKDLHEHSIEEKMKAFLHLILREQHDKEPTST